MTKSYDKYYVVRWQTNTVISEHTTLSAAKRAARQMGPEYCKGRFTGPTAFVGVITDYGDMGVLYNPRFQE